MAELGGNREVLQFLVEQKKIIHKNSLYALPTVNLATYDKRRVISQRKLKAIQQDIGLIGWIPTILGIALTGSVAAKNASKDDDIDLFIVTRKNTLWMTRMLVELLVFLNGKLRRPNSIHVNDLWCLNMWVDSDHLEMKKHDLYIAHEIVQAQWIVDKTGIEQRFIEENKWVKKFMMGEVSKKFSIRQLTDNLQFSKLTLLISYFLSLISRILDWFCYRAQLAYMRSRLTTEYVTRHTAFFHPHDVRADVLKKYERIMSEIRNRK
ncbi:hypothetical protein C5B42_02845 [Candidatus Cerribacteria bacterium 'Amazon FNV 2010 28 9']|uniref:Polymerase nucleotidyl transferase domain-containing protein n=1 Tax=Candidatus Cerribacteria bacterium 'Amazon FNV 2010 28 9' TaxID=2081795 RepID=A0A317JTZ4_9BACT|nr:MAG: hypothetical protein C5B42_02845 [Candidatus Cerribacteria bacterium 'Amazon FNV 2010 28 9']